MSGFRNNLLLLPPWLAGRVNQSIVANLAKQPACAAQKAIMIPFYERLGYRTNWLQRHQRGSDSPTQRSTQRLRPKRHPARSSRR